MWQDARLYQILFLSLFLLAGIGTRDWTLHPEIVLTAIATCITTQIVATWIEQTGKGVANREWGVGEQGSEGGFPSPQSLAPSPFSLGGTSLLSPLITSLGLSLILRTEHVTTMMLAAIAAISSKFLLRINGKHVFNPGNVGIVMAVLLTQDAWISPGQWGEESWYALLFLGAGGVVLQRVGRWDTTVAFLGSYAALEAGRNLWLGWTWDVWAHRLTSGSLLLFALFMVTDPRSIPNDRTARMLWASAIAILTFILRNVFFTSTAVFWALFVLSPVTPFLDRIWQAARFVWQKRSDGEPEVLSTAEL